MRPAVISREKVQRNVGNGTIARDIQSDADAVRVNVSEVVLPDTPDYYSEYPRFMKVRPLGMDGDSVASAGKQRPR